MVFSRRETATLLIGDFLILALSLWVALTLRNLEFPSSGYFSQNVVPFVPMFLVSLAIFYISGLYEKQTRPIRRSMGVRILGSQVATVGIAAILFFILPLEIAPKTILIIYLVVSVLAESGWRFYRMKRDSEGGHRELALVVGSGAAVEELYEEVNNNDRIMIRFLAHVETKEEARGGVYAAVAAALKEGVRIVVLDLSDPLVDREMSQLYALVGGKVTLVTFASLYEEIFDRVPLEHLDADQLIESVSRHRTVYDSAKRVFDIILALLIAVIAVPLVALAVIPLAATGGQPFITTARVGKGGKTFQILKLRTMLLNDHGDPELQKQNRVTRLGHLLRKTRLDELPQLWNILVGDLSFIGPRPELPTLAAVYEKEIPEYRMRHLIAPGLSGWAQIHDYDAPRGGADVARTCRKLSYDLYYLRHRSFGLDLAITIKTLRALSSFSGT